MYVLCKSANGVAHGWVLICYKRKGPRGIETGKKTDSNERPKMEECAKQSSFFVAVLEYLQGLFKNGGCAERNVMGAYQNMKNRSVSETMRRLQDLYVPYDMVAIVGAVLTRLEVELKKKGNWFGQKEAWRLGLKRDWIVCRRRGRQRLKNWETGKFGVG